MAKVRYLTISRLAIELVSSLSDADNAAFNKIVFSCFQQLEKGQQIRIQETDNPILQVAIREAVQELENGYRNYEQRINARKKSSNMETENQRSITDESPINQRLTIEKNRREKENKEEIYDTPNSRNGIGEAQRAEIERRLNLLGIEKIDSGFWNTCFHYGFDAVDAALSKAETIGDGNLKWITGMIKNGVA